MTTAMTATPARIPSAGPRRRAAGRPARAAMRGRFAFDGGRGACPQVARRLGLLVAQAAQQESVGLIRRGHGATRRTTGEVVGEPRGIRGIERLVQAPGRQRPGAIVDDDRLARPAPEAMHPAHR